MSNKRIRKKFARRHGCRTYAGARLWWIRDYRRRWMPLVEEWLYSYDPIPLIRRIK